MDPGVSKALFDDEVEKMCASARFGEQGWTLVSGDFPDLVVELPHPTGVRRRFRVRCDDWNEQPPSVKSVDGDGLELVNQPTGGKWAQLEAGYGLCAEWTHEYHVQHPENPWSAHKDRISLSRIVASVASHYRKADP